MDPQNANFIGKSERLKICDGLFAKQGVAHSVQHGKKRAGFKLASFLRSSRQGVENFSVKIIQCEPPHVGRCLIMLPR
jgi:hypothetical protein